VSSTFGKKHSRYATVRFDLWFDEASIGPLTRSMINVFGALRCSVLGALKADTNGQIIYDLRRCNLGPWLCVFWSSSLTFCRNSLLVSFDENCRHDGGFAARGTRTRSGHRHSVETVV
jgi:hypothetical protein